MNPTKPHRSVIGPTRATRFLWVGNSFFYYNNSLHNHVGDLSRAADPGSEYRGVSITISGAGLDWHDMRSYFRPNGVGRYSFTENNDIVFNEPGRQFDAVVMMDSSQGPVHPRLRSVFDEAVASHCHTIIEAGARPVLFMSWAYKDRPEMTGPLAEHYTQAGNANDALVIPAGLAFARAIARRPDLELYQADMRHPSLLGTYLAACVSSAALFRTSPVGVAYTAGIEGDTAGWLQRIAFETVTDYLS